MIASNVDLCTPLMWMYLEEKVEEGNIDAGETLHHQWLKRISRSEEFHIGGYCHPVLPWGGGVSPFLGWGTR